MAPKLEFTYGTNSRCSLEKGLELLEMPQILIQIFYQDKEVQNLLLFDVAAIH